MADEDEQRELHKQHMEKFGLETDQLAEMKECYAMFDKNDEGVQLENIGDVLRAMGQNPTEAEVKDMINEADGMGQNGIISLDEFITIAAPRLQNENEMEENLEEAFKVFDRLGTGYLDADEMKEKLRTLGETLDDDDINEMMKFAEPDKKGRIMYFDFVKKLTAK